METIFKIAKYNIVDNVFVKVGYDTYNITYLKGIKVHQLRIVVNGYLTKNVLNLIDFSNGYKKHILSAIKEYRENKDNIKNIVKNLTKRKIFYLFLGKIKFLLISQNCYS